MLLTITTTAQLCSADEELLLATPYKVVDVTNPSSTEEGILWWRELTARGGVGMVVKPFDFVVKGRCGIV